MEKTGKYHIVLIGAGNLAIHLGKALKSAGHYIDAVFSRTQKSADSLASTLNTIPLTQLKDIKADSDLYIISVPDNAIEKILQDIRISNKLIMHTSGSMPMKILSGVSENYGVFYPLQTFSKENEIDFKNIPICIEANSTENENILSELAWELSDNVKIMNSEDRKIAHVAAVFACNYSNFMFGIAEEILNSHNLSFDLIRPLIKETAAKVMQKKPHEVQTGPAVREDITTIENHLEILNSNPEYKKIYTLLAEELIKYTKTKNSMTSYKSLLRNINTFIFDYDGVLTNGIVILMEDGEHLRTANVKDGYAIQLAVKKGYRVAVITGGLSKTLETRFRALQVTDIFLGANNKLEIFEDYLSENNIKRENVLYMGDDIPDYEVMKKVGVPTCPADAAEEIKSISKYISHFKGGEGCVREIIEQVLKIQGKWMNNDAYDW